MDRPGTASIYYDFKADGLSWPERIDQAKKLCDYMPLCGGFFARTAFTHVVSGEITAGDDIYFKHVELCDSTKLQEVTGGTRGILDQF